MNPVAVAVLPVGMAILAGQDIRAARRARRCGAEGIREYRSPRRKGVNVRHLHDIVAVATRDRAPVVSDE